MSVLDHRTRMGKVMPFTSPDGATHPESFWCLERMSVEAGDGNVSLHFVGYHDAQAYDQGRTPVAGATKGYLISGVEFASVNALPVEPGQTIGAEVLRLAWVAALDTKDVPDPADENNHVSFFEAAVDA